MATAPTTPPDTNMPADTMAPIIPVPTSPAPSGPVAPVNAAKEAKTSGAPLPSANSVTPAVDGARFLSSGSRCYAPSPPSQFMSSFAVMSSKTQGSTEVCAALYCIVLHRIVLHRFVLRRVVLRRVVLSARTVTMRSDGERDVKRQL